MLTTLLSSAVAFVGTNIDDILVLTLLLSRTATRCDRLKIDAGYLLGVMVVAALAALAASGLRLLSGEWLRLLGLVPIVLGVRAWLKRGDADHGGDSHASLLGAALITLGNGADNLGVYIPLFTGYTASRAILAALTFLTMGALWSLLAARLASLPALRRAIARHSQWLVPTAFALLGIYILLL